MAYFKLIATEVGIDAGPFTIKSNTGAVLATGVTGAQLLAGYIFDVPAGVISITVENVVTNTICSTSETYPVPDPGFWEMEKGGAELVSDHYGVLLTPYVVPVESFSAAAVVGVYGGIVSGTGTWLIKSGPEDIGGTTYPGGGTLIATAASTNTLTTVESGAILQLGYDTNAYAGSLTGTATVNAGGNINVVGANETPGRLAFATLVNNGNTTFTGLDRCGEGYFRVTSLDNRNVVTVNNATFRPAAFAAGVGTILVNDGATLEAPGTGIPSTQTIQLNGCGKCAANGRDDGALLYGSAAQTIASPIQVQSPSCMKTQAGGATTFSGQITGNHKLMMDNQAGSSTASGTATFTNGTGGIFDNTLEVKNTTLYNTGTTALQKADIVLVGNGKMQQDGGTFSIGSLSSTSETATILANSSVTMNIRENGNTTYAGLLNNSTPGSPWTLNVYGPDTNEIKLTGAGGVVNLNSIDGAKIIAESGIYEFWNSTNGGTISAGTSKLTRIKTLYLQANAFLDVYAASPAPGCGKITSQSVAYLIAGWKVNIKDPLPAGTYDILVSPNPTGAYANLPTVAANASGLTASFAWVGTTLRMTLA